MMTDETNTRAPDDMRETVRQRYAALADLAVQGAYDEARELEAGDCTSFDACATGAAAFGAALYDDALREQATSTAIDASFGCGVPTAVADLEPGETVLDLGSGAGADVLISARRVGPTGRVIGLDMTDEMLALARRNAVDAGVSNVEFRKGYIEDIPLDDGAVDVVISNCVISLSTDRPAVFREAARVLRPGGRLAYTDVVIDDALPDHVRADAERATGCIAGAMTRDDVVRELAAAGFGDVTLRETHRVHEHAASAIVRASKPA